jgi:hypothetical protein
MRVFFLSIFIVSMLVSSFSKADTVLYCGGYEVEGAYLKINLDNKTMCYSGGAPGVDYCNNKFAVKYRVIEIRNGTLNVEGSSFGFTEIFGQDDKGALQFVRFFHLASNPSSTGETLHRAEMMGPVFLKDGKRPDLEIKSNEGSCARFENELP